MNKIRKNKALSITAAMLRTICVLCASGTLLQTFLATVGFTDGQIYLHATLVQAVNVSTILLFSHFADAKRPFLRSALVQIPNGLLFLALLPFCFTKGAGITAFVLLTAVSLLQSVLTALNTVCEYKFPYLLYRANDYSTVQAIAGVLSAAVTFFVGEALHYLAQTVSFSRLMLFAFLLSAVFMALAGGISLWFSPISRAERQGQVAASDGESAHTEAKKVPLRDVFRRPVFYLLVPANLLRGFASGTVAVLATVAIALGYQADLTTRMVSLSAVANLVACLLFGIASRFLSPRISIFAGSLCFLALPLCLLGSPTLFLVAYAVVFFGRGIVDVGVPSLLICAVDAEIAGPYNAWRMILHNGGTMLATAIAPFLSPTALLTVSLVASILSGVCFLSLGVLRRASPTLVSGRPHLFRRTV